MHHNHAKKIQEVKRWFEIKCIVNPKYFCQHSLVKPWCEHTSILCTVHAPHHEPHLEHLTQIKD